MESHKSQSLKRRKYNGPVGDVKVLVVDANSACRAIVSKMLLSLGYEGNWHLFWKLKVIFFNIYICC